MDWGSSQEAQTARVTSGGCLTVLAASMYWEQAAAESIDRSNHEILQLPPRVSRFFAAVGPSTRHTPLLVPGPAMWGSCRHGDGVMHGIVAVGGGGVCDEVRDGWFWVVVAGFLGGGVGVGGGVAVGAWWVYCFLSRREGDQRKCWEPEAANPLNFKTGSGRRFVRSGFGWGGLDGLRVAEALICKAVRTRVSLKSCSGAIRDRNVGCGGAGCVCCLRTQ